MGSKPKRFFASLAATAAEFWGSVNVGALPCFALVAFAPLAELWQLPDVFFRLQATCTAALSVYTT